jgi:hypothetical protein
MNPIGLAALGVGLWLLSKNHGKRNPEGMATKKPKYLQDDEWATWAPDKSAPELWRSVYRLNANTYQTEPVQGEINVTVDDYGNYFLNLDWDGLKPGHPAWPVEPVMWQGDQKTLDKARKLVARGVRAEVTELNRSGRSERAQDFKEHKAWKL